MKYSQRTPLNSELKVTMKKQEEDKKQGDTAKRTIASQKVKLKLKIKSHSGSPRCYMCRCYAAWSLRLKITYTCKQEAKRQRLRAMIRGTCHVNIEGHAMWLLRDMSCDYWGACHVMIEEPWGYQGWARWEDAWLGSSMGGRRVTLYMYTKEQWEMRNIDFHSKASRNE